MTAVNRATLYTYFETGDRPTQSNYQDLIDSCVNQVSTSAQTVASEMVFSASAEFNGSFKVTTTASFTSDISVSGNVAPAGGIVGVTNGGNAATGIVGELLTGARNSGSALSLSTGTPSNITTVSLTPGDYDVSGTVVFVPAGTTILAGAISSLSQTTGTLSGANDGSNVQVANQGTGNTVWIPVGPTRVSISSASTMYLVGQASFSVSTLTAWGNIRARRMR